MNRLCVVFEHLPYPFLIGRVESCLIFIGGHDRVIPAGFLWMGDDCLPVITYKSCPWIDGVGHIKVCHPSLVHIGRPVVSAWCEKTEGFIKVTVDQLECFRHSGAWHFVIVYRGTQYKTALQTVCIRPSATVQLWEHGVGVGTVDQRLCLYIVPFTLLRHVGKPRLAVV